MISDKFLSLVIATWAASVMPAGAIAQANADGWSDRIDFGGDLRLRRETIRQTPGSDKDRERYRARFSITADLTDNLDAVVRLATGTGDPVSANLDFGESFTLDDVQLDRAYLNWSINDKVALMGGKMKNPLYRVGDNALIWDSDLNPEGIAGTISSGLWFGTAGAYRLAGQDSGRDSKLYAAQGGVEIELSQTARMTAGLSYFDYTNTRGEAPFYDGKSNGNSVDGSGNFLFDYDIVEVFAGYTSKLGDWPVGVFADWAKNTAAPAADTAYVVGINLGKADAPHTMAFSWAWYDTEADALVGLYTDSDLGNGNTDSRGHELGAKYALTENAVLGATYLISEFGVSSAAPTDFNRLMLDIEFSF